MQSCTQFLIIAKTRSNGRMFRGSSDLSVFVNNQKSSPNVYELLGAAQLGAVVVVRPDGYVSIVQEISKFNGDELTGFFLNL